METVPLTMNIKKRVPWDKKEVIEEEEYSIEWLKLKTRNQLQSTSSTSVQPGATSRLLLKKNEITNAETNSKSPQARN